jgi:hypothetical protein
VGTNVEVRLWRTFLASALPTLDEAFVSKKCRFPWEGLAFKLFGQCLLQFLDPLKAD